MRDAALRARHAGQMQMQREFWDQVAGPMWVAAQEQMDRMLAPYCDTLRPVARLPAGGLIVDVGCGCGATTLMAREESPTADIVGLDVSRPMLVLAEQRAREREATGPATRFVLGDAETHAMEGVDVVVSRFGVMFFADPVAAFVNMRRWLAPAGRIVAVVWGRPEDNPWMTQATGVLGRHIDLPPRDPVAPGPFSLGDDARRRSIFDAAGLRVVEELVLDEPVRVEGSLDDVVKFYGERGPVLSALDAASADARARALAALREHVVSIHDGGGVTLPAQALRVTLAP